MKTKMEEVERAQEPRFSETSLFENSPKDNDSCVKLTLLENYFLTFLGADVLVIKMTLKRKNTKMKTKEENYNQELMKFIYILISIEKQNYKNSDILGPYRYIKYCILVCVSIATFCNNISGLSLNYGNKQHNPKRNV